MNNLPSLLLFLGIMISSGCQKKEAYINPLCMEKAKEFLKKDEKTFFKGAVSKALLNDKSILIVLNRESGAETVLDDSCNSIYSCCGYTCDCSPPKWRYEDIKNKQLVLEVQ